MIFLSAQPDDYYFTWQLELQLYNFNKLGIAPENIHVLIGYDPKRGLRHYFKDLIKQNKDKATFFTYPDTRVQKSYDPSIRPHIIRKHFQNNPTLSNCPIFYHDADIIFRELPLFDEMLKDDIWYLSDTSSYTGSKYIKENAGTKTFNAMCNVVGIDSEIVSNSDFCCGGAQYLMKSVDEKFWEKVERDCENLFVLMEDHNNLQSALIFEKYGIKKQDFVGIQSWCADMWVVFWNGLLFGKKILLHPELDFLISKSPISEWDTKKILHYSGEAINAPGPIFRKINYFHFKPYYDISLETTDFSKTVSYHLVNLILEYKKNLDLHRINLKDVTFLIPVRIDSESRLNNLHIITAYLNKYFDVNIIIAESDTESKIDIKQLPPNCDHIFIQDDNTFLHRTKVNNIMIRKAQTDLVVIYDSDVIIPVDQILESVNMIRNNHADMVSPYDGEFIGVTNLFKTMMSKILDSDLLVLNVNKFDKVARRSYGGAAFLKRDSYLKAGMENEYFTSWGPEDVERPKRMSNLGFKAKRVAGPLFHLPHERNINSGYPDSSFYQKFMEEFLKIADMDKAELEAYIRTWPWNN